MYKRTLLILLPFLIGITCITFFVKQKEKVVRLSDYRQYLNPEKDSINQRLLRNQKSVAFWKEKLQREPHNSIYLLKLSSLLSRQFKITGDVQLLNHSDSLLHNALAGPLLDKTPFYQALSTNALTQHDFQNALRYAEAAVREGRDPESSKLLSYDALMELGRVEAAKKTLLSYPRKNNFQYLIRKAKLQDQEGDLFGAIQTMEAVAEWCKEVDNRNLLCWTLSNLGDMYSHAGWVDKSYDTYLQVLAIDPAYHYALKGIAWIAYSHDQDIRQADRIVEYLLSVQSQPDLYLFKAELAAYQQEIKSEKKYQALFTAQAAQPAYGRMYHKYLAEMMLEKPELYNKAENYVRREIENRPTPQSYALLARYYEKTGQVDRALHIIRTKVEGRSFEPDVLSCIGMIYKSAGLEEEAENYLAKASEAALELGPLKTKAIQQAIAGL